MATTSADAGMPKSTSALQSNMLVIGASSLGTVFEWYDFYLYGLLAAVISSQFFSGVNEITGFIFALAAFAAGFAVRPFGALVFGRLGGARGADVFPAVRCVDALCESGVVRGAVLRAGYGGRGSEGMFVSIRSGREKCVRYHIVRYRKELSRQGRRVVPAGRCACR